MGGKAVMEICSDPTPSAVGLPDPWMAVMVHRRGTRSVKCRCRLDTKIDQSPRTKSYNK